MGIEAVAKQANAKIFISGMGPLGIEVAKNMILAGCKTLTIHDTKDSTNFDMSGQFFISETSINRATASKQKLQQLNNYVKVETCTTPLISTKFEDILADFNVVVLTDMYSESLLTEISAFCHTVGIHFIIANVMGMYSRVFVDFGDKFEIGDKDGEELQEVMIKDISEDGIVTLLDGTKHNFEDGDEVQFKEVKGMVNEEGESVNGQIRKITVINP